jgi:hypothetical protein
MTMNPYTAISHVSTAQTGDMANLDELGTHHGTESIKRLQITPTQTRYLPDNTPRCTSLAHEPIGIDITSTETPIPGELVALA